MSYIQLQFPILVESVSKEGYRLRPLLFEGPIVTQKRYSKALESFRKAIRKHFKGFRLDRDNLAGLLWHSFDPGCRIAQHHYSFRFGKRGLDSRFSLAFYSLGKKHFVCFPKLAHQTCLLENKKDSHYESLQGFFRVLRKKQGENVDLSPYLYSKHESLSIFKIGLEIVGAPFSFEAGYQEYMAMTTPHGALDGQEELEKVGHNLNDAFPDDLAIAHQREALVGRIKDTLYQAQATCLALVGPTGCGKSTLLQAAVRAFLEEEPQKAAQKKPQLWYIDPLRVISGMSQVGMWQRRIESILHHLRHRLKKRHRIPKTDLLYIDRPVALFHIGKSAQNSLTLADVLKPYLEKRILPLVIEASPQEWQKAQELDRRFTDLFEVLRVEPPDAVTALTMISLRRSELEHAHSCRFHQDALAALWDLRAHLSTQAGLPGSLVLPMQQLAARLAENEIRQADVYQDFQASYRFQEIIFNPEITLDSKQIQHFFARHLIGQERAKQALEDTIHLIKSRLSDPEKPLASLLFIGPTGVGKTEAAKVLAKFLFVDDSQLVRFDMNEYVGPDAVGRLIGDPMRPEGQLTAKVRFHQACVLLLDEIEKAHPAVHDLLLQVLGEGRLTDALGRSTDFRQCVIIMTSNLGAGQALKQMGFVAGASDQTHTYSQAVESFFRPEFRGRIDQQVIFEPLSPAQTQALARLEMGKLLRRDGFSRRTTFFNVTPDSLAQVAQSGFDAKLGGRALKRNIERSLTALTANKLVTIAPDRPLLLEIYQQDQQLRPHLQALDFESFRGSSLPALSEAELPQALLRLYQQVLDREATLNEQIDHGDSEHRIVLWALKEQIMGSKRVLSDIAWDIENWKGRSPFQIRRRSRLSEAWRITHTDHALSLQQHIEDYLKDRYASAQALAEYSQPFYLQHAHACQMLHYRLQTKSAQRLGFCLSSCIEGQGQAALTTLQQYYTNLLHALDIDEIEVQQQGEQLFMVFESKGLSALLLAETGLHLIADAERKILPYRLLIQPYDKSSSEWRKQAAIHHLSPPERPPLGKVVRLYHLATDPKHNLLFDLASGLLCAGPLQAHDWVLLMLARASLA